MYWLTLIQKQDFLIEMQITLKTKWKTPLLKLSFEPLFAPNLSEIAF